MTLFIVNTIWCVRSHVCIDPVLYSSFFVCVYVFVHRTCVWCVGVLVRELRGDYYLVPSVDSVTIHTVSTSRWVHTESHKSYFRLKKSEVWQQMISFGWTVHFTFFRLTLFPPIILLDAGICKHVIGQQRTQLCSTSSPLPMGRRAQTSCLETQCLKRNVKWPL